MVYAKSEIYIELSVSPVLSHKKRPSQIRPARLAPQRLWWNCRAPNLARWSLPVSPWEFLHDFLWLRLFYMVGLLFEGQSHNLWHFESHLFCLQMKYHIFLMFEWLARHSLGRSFAFGRLRVTLWHFSDLRRGYKTSTEWWVDDNTSCNSLSPIGNWVLKFPKIGVHP